MPRLDSPGLFSLTPKILADFAAEGILSGNVPSSYVVFVFGKIFLQALTTKDGDTTLRIESLQKNGKLKNLTDVIVRYVLFYSSRDLSRLCSWGVQFFLILFFWSILETAP